jgi:hypothetical protein
MMDKHPAWLYKTLIIGVIILLICSPLILVGLGYQSSSLNNINFSFTSKNFYPIQEEWNKTYGGYYTDLAYSAQQTNDGGFILTGKRNWIDSDNAGSVWLIKTNKIGNIEWDETFVGPGDNWGSCIKQTSDDGYIIVGVTNYKLENSDSGDIWLIKTDNYGNHVWNRTFGENGSIIEVGWYIEQTSDGGFILTGTKRDYDIGEIDLWLIKTDSSGKMLWNKTYGGEGVEHGYCVQITSDEGYVICGVTSSYDEGFWLLKTDENGNEEWNKTYDGSFLDDAYIVRQTIDNGYILIGSKWDSNNSSDDFRLIKTDSLGNKLWDKTYGGNDRDWGRFVYQTSDGGFLLSGWTESFCLKNTNIWFVKTDKDGNLIWDKSIGGSSFEFGYYVEEISDGGYIIAGSTRSYGSGSADVWLVKMSADTKNNPPEKPFIDGPAHGLIDLSYNYSFVTPEPDGNYIWIYIDWDDGNKTGWIGPYKSREEIIKSHKWTAEGTYVIHVKAKDRYDAESEWSELEITIPRTRASSYLWFEWFLERFPLLGKLLILFR